MKRKKKFKKNNSHNLSSDEHYNWVSWQLVYHEIQGNNTGLNLNFTNI